MPETRGEWTVFAIGALAIAALVALIALQSATDRLEARDTSMDTAPLARGTTAEVTASTQPAESTAPQATTAPDTTSAAEPAGASRTARLTLTAIADTWVEVRSGSADGEVLYSGVLPQGAKERFRRAHLWASFGAAANLTAQLNGRPLKLRPGTYTALVGARGLKPL